MPTIQPSRLVDLQSASSHVRNICILAHVDHGKTSLTDSLIATNGIISPKMAGKIRYLDSRPDEQLRGITMESSAISLYFSMLRRASPADEPKQEEYLINLIDSPGHIDFSSEVSTASRLCDAAVVLVDAVEGVCSQTVTVLRQVWLEKLKPLLVINKIDRLVTELKMTPAEAYSHLERVLEGVNAVIGGFFQGERMEEDLLWREKADQRRKERSEKALNGGGDDQASEADVDGAYEEKDDEDLYFAPEKNNVIFASALDGWAFTIRQFAAIYGKKLGIKRSVLEKVLWGDFYLDPKTKKVLGQKHLKGRNLKPIFVQLVLEPVWAVYEATVGTSGRGDPALLEKITKSLSITLPPHVLRSRDSKTVLQAVFTSWLPLSTALLVSVIEYLPSPPVAQSARLPDLIEDLIGADKIDQKVKDSMVHFNTDKDAPVVAYVSKMVAIPESELPSKRRKMGTTLTPEEARELGRKKRAELAKAQAEDGAGTGVDDITNGVSTTAIGVEVEEDTARPEQPDDPEHLIGFARLFSGSLSVGDEIYVLPPKYNPAFPHASPEPKKVPVTALYLLMGRSLEPLETVPAGVVFGIEGLEGQVLKTGTLCSQLEGGINLSGLSTISQPIVRVALEPTNPLDLNKMITGLKLLEQSDPSAVYEQMPSGEHVILTAGELHLERCLKDLRERFAKCDIQPGEPIVPYRETIVKAPEEEMEPLKNKDLPRGTTIAIPSSDNAVSIRLRVRPLPPGVTDFLIKHGASIRRFYADQQAAEDQQTVPTPNEKDSDDSDSDDSDQQAETQGQSTQLGDDATASQDHGTTILSLADFRTQLENAFTEATKDDKTADEIWKTKDLVSHICAFGPRRVGPNIFFDVTGAATCKRFLVDHPKNPVGGANGGPDVSETTLYAFQLATSQGPLCREPMQGVAVFLEEVKINTTNATTSNNTTTNANETKSSQESTTTNTNSGRLTGRLILSVRESIRASFLDWSPRLLLALYSLTIQSTPEVLGKVYSVLTRRRGSILSESLLEGTPYFTIEASLPVAESFGFSDEIRKKTSGLAQPQLRFTGYGLPEGTDVDPNWVPRSEEELEDLGVWGERENVAKRYVDGVRRRKGLLVRGVRGGRDAEKQKTMKSN